MHLHSTVLIFVTFATTAVFGLTESDIAEQVNSNPEATWTEGINFGGSNSFLGDLKKRNAVRKETEEATRSFESISTPFEAYEVGRMDLPESFDSRKEWPNCKSIGLIRDTGMCGSAWALAAAEAISDRICIAYNQTVNPFISAEDLMTCCHECAPTGGCVESDSRLAWKYWVTDGIVTGGLFGTRDGCKSYAYPPCANYTNIGLKCPTFDTPKCEKKCQPDYTNYTYNDDKYYGSQVYMIQSSNITELEKYIMADIFTQGPVEASMDIYYDFYLHKTGVYKHLYGDYRGENSVKLLGWGVDRSIPKKPVKYWLAANSWGESWGDKGFFKIVKGGNECGIESKVVAGIPAY